MLLRGALALMTLTGTIAVLAGGCSSGDQRDQNYGKDVATTYVEPEAGARDAAAPRDAGIDASADAENPERTDSDVDASDATSDGAPG